MSGIDNGEKGGGTPPSHFLQTNTDAPIPRRRGGQPGNDNALKHGRRTSRMTALRAEVRFAVLKAKALAAMAWTSPPVPAKRDENSSLESTGRRPGGG